MGNSHTPILPYLGRRPANFDCIRLESRRKPRRHTAFDVNALLFVLDLFHNAVFVKDGNKLPVFVRHANVYGRERLEQHLLDAAQKRLEALPLECRDADHVGETCQRAGGRIEIRQAINFIEGSDHGNALNFKFGQRLLDGLGLLVRVGVRHVHYVQKQIGFGAKIPSKKDLRVWDLLREAQPEDLLKYGMIPEFVGRLPVLAPLHELDEATLVDILTKPKNALTKQYQKLFEMDGVKLRFTKGALSAIAGDAKKYKSGARGLRAILEHAMMDIMFEIPSAGANIKEVVINEETIQKGEQPLLMYQKGVAVVGGERS